MALLAEIGLFASTTRRAKGNARSIKWKHGKATMLSPRLPSRKMTTVSFVVPHPHLNPLLKSMEETKNYIRTSSIVALPTIRTNISGSGHHSFLNTSSYYTLSNLLLSDFQTYLMKVGKFQNCVMETRAPIEESTADDICKKKVSKWKKARCDK